MIFLPSPLSYKFVLTPAGISKYCSNCITSLLNITSLSPNEGNRKVMAPSGSITKIDNQRSNNIRYADLCNVSFIILSPIVPPIYNVFKSLEKSVLPPVSIPCPFWEIQDIQVWRPRNSIIESLWKSSGKMPDIADSSFTSDDIFFPLLNHPYKWSVIISFACAEYWANSLIMLWAAFRETLYAVHGI